MPVKLISGGKLVPSLTSPPEHPDPYPPDELIAKKISYGDRDVLVTVPFPDTIELTTDVYNHHLMEPYATGGSAKWIYTQIDKDMIRWVKGYHTGETVFEPAPKARKDGSKAVYRIPYDPDQPLHVAHLEFWRSAGDNYPVWKLKLNFSASKAGSAGLLQLTSRLDNALPLVIDKVLGTMLVRRIDPAIDIIGAEPLDLIAHVPKPGKRMIYVGDHGRPESVYLYEKKAALKKPPTKLKKRTTGPLRLKLYERMSYQLQLLLEPPYGPCPVTRAEVECVWDQAAQRPPLAELADLKNQFVDRRVAYAATAAGPLPSKSAQDWVRFCLAAFGGGIRKSQSKSSLAQGLKFRSYYENCAGDLIDEDAWHRWVDGIAYTGLSDWIERAKANSQ